MSLILNPDRTKMSKRKSQTALSAYRAQGFLPEAIVNYLGLLGWSSGTDQDLFTVDELIGAFDLDRVQPSGAVFDRERLEWMNGQWIRRLDDADLADRLLPHLAGAVQDRLDAGAPGRPPTADDVTSLLPMVRERLPLLSSIGPLVDFVFVDDVAPDRALLVPKRWDAQTTAEALRAARAVIAETGAVAFEADELEPPLRALAELHAWKAGDLFMAIRVATTGRTATPPLFDTLVAIGRDEVLARIDRAISSLERIPDRI
jgi:glutamyl-tRNA synthetase